MGNELKSLALLRKVLSVVGITALISSSLLTTSCSMQFFRNKNVSGAPITQTNTKHTVTVGHNYPITLSGGSKPFNYKIVSGSGSISTSGVYSAPATVVNPSADGSEPIVIMVTDSRQKSTTITLYLVDVLALNSNNVDIVPSGTFAFSATGGKPPYSYSVISGVGSVDSAGLFTATAAQGVSFVQVTDVDGNFDQAMVNVFLPLNPAVVNINIPVNTTYTITPTTGTPNFNFAITLGSGSLSTASAASTVYTAPAAPGTAQVTVTDQLAATKVYAFNIYQPLTYVPTSKNVQVLNSFPFGVTGGVPPYSHAVISGAASGSIVAGTGNFTATGVPGAVVIQVTDSIANTATANVNVYSALSISPTPFSMMVSTNQTFSGAGGVPPYTYSVFAGGGSIVAGTGAYTAGAAPGAVTIRVTDSVLNTADATVTVTGPLTVPPLVVLAPTNTYNISPTGGQGPFTFAFTAGTAGGTLGTAGPAAASLFTAALPTGTRDVTVTDSSTPIAQTATVTFQVNPALGMTCSQTTITTANTSTCTATNGVPGYTYSVVGGAPNGTITGGGVYTPPAGSGTYTVRVTDSYGNIFNVPITVNAAISLAPAASAIAVAQNQVVTVSGGVGPFVFSKQSGPADASVVTLTGTTAKGVAGMTPGTLVVQVTDSLGNTATASIGIGTPPAINGAPSTRNIHKSQTDTITPSGGAPSVNGTLNYSFAIISGGGSLSLATGLSTVYTAPGATGSATVRITDGTSTPYDIVYTIIPDLTISPTTYELMVNNTKTFTASNVVGTATYSVVSAGGGSIVAGTGAYTAPAAVPGANPATVRVTDSGPQQADALVTIDPQLAVVPAAVSLLTTQTQNLTISGGVQPYTFSFSGTGSINPSGLQGMGVTSTLFSAGAVAGPGTFTVTDAVGNIVNVATSVGNVAAPTGFIVIGATPTSINTQWNVVAAATGYQVRVDGGSWTDIGNVLTYNFTGLSSGSTHTLDVLAYNGGGPGSWTTLNQKICAVDNKLSAGACVVCNIGEFSAGGIVASCTACTNAAGSFVYTTMGGGVNNCTYSCNNGYGSSSCSACGPGNYDPTGGGIENCSACSASTYSNGVTNTSCTNCSVGTWSAAGANTCGACTNNTVGNYWTTNGTTAAGCTNTACTNKLGTSTYTGHGGTTNTCAYACNAGYGSVNCTGCGPGTWDSVPNGQENCVNCTASNYSAGAANSSCSSCAIGTWSGAGASSCGACTNTTAGFYWTTNGTSATTCTNTACTNGVGTFTYTSHGGTSPTGCTYACNSGYGTSSCTQCTAGTYDGTAGGQEACATCAAATYSAAGATSCTACNVGTWAAAGSGSCAACTNNTVGNYWTSNGTTAGGCTNTACTNKLGTSTYNSHGGTTNTCGYDCNAGYGTASCIGCGIDTKDGTAGGQEACVACSSGQYAAALSTTCTNCTNKPVNAASATYSAVGGGVNQCPYTAVTCNAAYEWNGTTTYAGAACNACAVGQWSAAGGTCAACTNTTVGNYWISNATVAGGCLLASCTTKLGTSTYTSHGGTTDSCTYACNAGYGTVNCTQCGIDTKDGTAGGQEACVACAAGQFAAAGSTSCTACSNGAGSFTYTLTGGGSNNCSYSCNAGYGSASCTQCGFGTYDGTGGGQEACVSATPGNAVGTLGATSQTNCNPGEYMPNSGASSCWMTSPGYYTNASVQTSQTACGVDQRSNAVTGNFGSTGCIACGAGTYAATGSDSCTSCTNAPANSTSVTYSGTGGGSNACNFTSVTCSGGYTWNGNTTAAGAACNLAACAAGTGWNGSACVTCTAGTYDATPGTGLDACTSAGTGYYVPGTGATSQTACTNGPTNSATVTYGASSGLTTNTCPVSSFTCAGGYWVNGAVCSPNINCYMDADNDGYTVASATSYGGSSCPLGAGTTGAGLKPLSGTTDCCDTDANAKPGQTTYFSVANNCGNYDYDCDGSTTKNYSGKMVQGSYIGTQADWSGYTSATNCTGATTGPLGSVWVWTSAGAPTAACGSTFSSCNAGLPVFPFTGGSTSMMFGSCVSSATTCFDSSSSSPTTTTYCK